jgi:hypothetical protein
MSDGPFHIVNRLSGKHVGPFTTESDCALAKTIATPDWTTGIVMDKKQFKKLFNGDSVPPYNPKPGDKATLFGEMALVDDDLTPGAIYIGVKVQGV